MKKLGDLLKELRGKESLREASKRIGISHTYLDTIEKGVDKRSGSPVNPTPDTLKLISQAYDYDYEKLLKAAGYLDDTTLEENGSNSKDERDIAKRMEQIRKDLTSEDGLMFNGEPMSEEAVESFLEAMEYAVRQTQRINKKYIPKKYRDNKEN